MPNPVPAAGEAMPKITRRIALVSITAGVAATVSATAAEPRAWDLAKLLSKHREAFAAADVASEAVSVIEDGPTLKALPTVRVRLGEFSSLETADRRYFRLHFFA